MQLTFRSRSLVGALAFAVSLGCAGEVPRPAAGLSTYDSNGEPLDPFEREDAKAQVFVFIQSDCPISNRYAPTLERLHHSFGPDVQFWLVYPDPSETAASIREHRTEYGYTVPALRDPEHSLASLAGATVTPEAAVFLDRERLVYRGRIDDRFPAYGVAREPETAELERALEAIRDGRRIEPSFTDAVGCFITDLQ